MTKYISIVDESGAERQYRIPDFGELTVAHWRELCQPNEVDDALIEDLKRYSGIPKKTLLRLRPAQVDELIAALVSVRADAEARAMEVSGEDWSNPTTIIHEGVTYTVPQDLERDTCFAQWVDLDLAIDKVDNDADCMADICAALLVEQGKEYEGMHVTSPRFETLPARVAMGLTAFFLGRSERLRSVMARYTHRLLTSRLRTLVPDGTST